MADTNPTLTAPKATRVHRHKLPTAALGLDAAPDGKSLFAACFDGVYQVDVESGECRRLYEHESYVSGAVVVEPGSTLVSAGYDGALTWFDLAGGTKIRTVQAHQFWSWQMARSPDSKRVASVTGQYLAGSYKYDPAPEREPSVRVYDVASGKLVHSFPHVPSVQAVAFSPEGRHLAAANLVGEIRVYDLDAGKQVAAWKTDSFTSWGIIKSHCYVGGIFALAFTPDGNDVIAAGMGFMADPMAANGRQLWQRFAWRENPVRKVDETHEKESGEGLMESLAMHPSGVYFLMTGRLRGGNWNSAFFSVADGKLLHSFTTGTRITRAVFSPDGKRLYLSGTQRQPAMKDGKIEPFGHVDIYDVA
jgi:WD40 repeat protein